MSKIAIASLLLGTVLVAQSAEAASTSLADYVAQPDPNYGYTIEEIESGVGYTLYQVRLTSQAWRTTEDVAEDDVVWKHWLTIYVPSNAVSGKALMGISGGSDSSGVPDLPSELAAYAIRTRSVVAALYQVPNQPIFFADESEGRYEDEILAYSLDKALVTGDDTWPVHLAMVKSAVAAMDTVQDVVNKHGGGSRRINVEEFALVGASKRGWTTWLTSAVDDRVIAAVPMVIDVLDMDAQLDHHYRAYGFYSDALQDYEDFDIPCRVKTPEGQALLEIVDPLSYASSLDLPVYMINATGDQFFLPDGSKFYLDQLAGPKFVRYVPNVDHGLSTAIAPSALTWYESIIAGNDMPEYSWTMQSNGNIRLTTDDLPTQVLLWQATNPNARDFRVETIGEAWTSTPVSPTEIGIYEGALEAPSTGYSAYFLEMTYPSGDPAKPFIVTTDVQVIPDVLPYDSELCE